MPFLKDTSNYFGVLTVPGTLLETYIMPFAKAILVKILQSTQYLHLADKKKKKTISSK